MTDSDRRIYVTGAAGLIGSNVVQALLTDGHAVIGIDNFWRGTQANIRQLSAHSKFVFRHADLAADQRWFISRTLSPVLATCSRTSGRYSRRTC